MSGRFPDGVECDDARSVASAESEASAPDLVAPASPAPTRTAPAPTVRRRRVWQLRRAPAESGAGRSPATKRRRERCGSSEAETAPLLARVAELKARQQVLLSQVASASMDQIVLRARQAVILRRLRARLAAQQRS